MLTSLWGDALVVAPETAKVTKVKSTVAKPKSPVVKTSATNVDDKTLSIEERLQLITAEVYRILGRYRENTIVIDSYDKFVAYIDSAIENGYLAVDTETNNSLDPLTCKLMGLCLYTEGQKQAYIPVNHVNYNTGERLDWQVTEKQIKEQLDRLKPAKVKNILHHGSFDYQVLKHTCGCRISIYWDTMIGTRMFNENEPNAKLKPQYIDKIDPSVEHYSIDHLFANVQYAVVPPRVFALYAATDSFMTMKLFRWQFEQLSKPENADVLKCCLEVEMPCVEVIAEMESTGVGVDYEFANKLSALYHKQYDALQIELQSLLDTYKDKVSAWRKTPEAQYHPFTYGEIKRTGKKLKQSEYPEVPDPVKHSNPNLIKYYKSKSEKLVDPLTIDCLTSPQQLSILLYDVLGFEAGILDKPRDKNKPDYKPSKGTGEDILEALDKKYHEPLLHKILDNRGFLKLITTYVDVIPKVTNPSDDRVHTHFNQLGAACITGDSLLLTDDGYVQMSGIFDGSEKSGEFYPHDVTVVNKDLQLEHASHRIMFANVPTVKVNLRGGYSVEGTPHHPVICTDITLDDIYRNKSARQRRRLSETWSFKQLGTLKKGDTVAIPYGYNIFPSNYQPLDCEVRNIKFNRSNCTFPKYCDEDFAELLGMYHADGTYKHHSDVFSVQINNSDPEVFARVSYLVKKLFGLTAHYCKDSRTKGGSIAFGSLCIVDLERYLQRGARNKVVPDIIMRSPKSVMCAYIRGMTLDSTFDKQRQRLVISCANKVSMNFLRDSLTNMGILGSVHRGMYDNTHDHMGNAVEPLAVQRLGVSGEMYGKFLQEVGVVQSAKALHLDKYKKSTYLTYGNVFYSYVEDIQASTNTVYDLHVPASHSFIANSMINHNTGRTSSSDPINLQNIPSHNHLVRMLFKATNKQVDKPVTDDVLRLYKKSKVKTPNGLITGEALTANCSIYVNNDKGNTVLADVVSCKEDGDYVLVTLKER